MVEAHNLMMVIMIMIMIIKVILIIFIIMNTLTYSTDFQCTADNSNGADNSKKKIWEPMD